jgi:hypothetical protein
MTSVWISAPMGAAAMAYEGVTAGELLDRSDMAGEGGGGGDGGGGGGDGGGGGGDGGGGGGDGPSPG